MFRQGSRSVVKQQKPSEVCVLCHFVNKVLGEAHEGLAADFARFLSFLKWQMTSETSQKLKENFVFAFIVCNR